MALVLAATGAFLYLRLAASLDETIDDGLRTRAGDVRVLLQRDPAALEQRGEGRGVGDEGFAQSVDAEGFVQGATSPGVLMRFLTAEELARVGSGGAFVERRLPGDDEDWRLFVRPAVPTSIGGRSFVVVGTSLEQRGDALEVLLAQLAIGLPLALVLASVAGYGVAASALRPVDTMRRRADEISGARAGERLPVPEARDEIARLGETLNAMLARLEEALARERTFVADASHELRTPLALLKTELELALRHPRSVEELERAVRSAADETDRLAQLAEDLLVLARSDQGRLPLRRERVRVRDVLDGVRERFVRRAQEAGRSIAVDAPDELELSADRLRLEQAVGNLVDNALRHGGGSIVLVGREEGARVTLHVRDEGRGFPPEFLGRAFERFTRPDGARTGGGAGLGLAIVDAIARAHAGSAGVENLPGGGAEAWLALPREA